MPRTGRRTPWRPVDKLCGRCKRMMFQVHYHRELCDDCRKERNTELVTDYAQTHPVYLARKREIDRERHKQPKVKEAMKGISRRFQLRERLAGNYVESQLSVDLSHLFNPEKGNDAQEHQAR